MISFSGFDPSSSIFGLFGGKKKFDMWLTETADILANPNDPRVRPVKLDEKVFPSHLQELMQKPHEVLDNMINTLENINAWKYFLKGKGEKVEIIDEVSGHIVEVGNEFELRNKYGVVNGN